jgi:putative SOS response-associated peptidase YedK
MQTGSRFAFAGLWASWRDPAGATVDTCTIITTTANTLVQPVHHRMPVILPPAEYRRWLAVESTDPEELLSALAPYPANPMEAYPVSHHVNHTKNTDSTCIAPTPTTRL